MKNIGLTSIAVMALIGQVDKATALEMTAAQKDNLHIDHHVATSPTNDQNLTDKKVDNAKDKSKKTDKNSSTNTPK